MVLGDPTGPNNSSQHNQSNLILHLADHAASIQPMILPLSNCDSFSYCLRKRLNGMSTSALTFGRRKLYHILFLWLVTLAAYFWKECILTEGFAAKSLNLIHWHSCFERSQY
ncbi:hypothetical protein TNCV_4673011 [Trichonephila clavipes]|nr:hypothetical protein TNCV_4673011 [Trichonephila clavipes]